MKLTKSWRDNKRPHKPKRVGPKPQIPWQLLGLPDPADDQNAISMDEVRHQVVLMSSRGFGEAVQSCPSTDSAKGHGRKEQAKPGRRPRHGAIE